MPHVVAIGSHPSEFLTHLEAAGYTYTTDQAYSEVSHPKISIESTLICRYKSILNTDEVPVAVAVHGSDVGLESTQAILSLLKAKVILLLFSPSLTLLKALKSAIGTVIDLPQLNLKDNVPLIVFKFILFPH